MQPKQRNIAGIMSLKKIYLLTHFNYKYHQYSFAKRGNKGWNGLDKTTVYKENDVNIFRIEI